ncbi:MAG: heat shock protein DnaJ domain protein [Myxococcales bacterium]|nr:heat shock protein DnaJ domain protein [Myxococcales bacterium]
MAGRTLQVRCSTWDQVTVFTTRKLRKGKLLSMKVPFPAKNGMPVTLGLELPNQLVIAIEGVVQKASDVEGEGGGKTWIEIELTGFTEEVHARIRAMAAEKAPSAKEPKPMAAPVSPAPQRKSGPPADEDLPDDERQLFLHLSSELRRLRQAAVHDVLGVERDANPDAIRAGWKNLVRRHHPDLVARRNAPAISHLAEELTILSNRAYDRLRSALVAEGRGLAVGPHLSQPPGWLVGFEDLQSTGSVPSPSPAPVKPAAAAAPSTAQGGEAFEQRARTMLGEGDASTAREVLAAALVVYPRSKPLRSLYYVATALVALSEGELQLATAQLETALAHHEQCVEASRVLDHVKKHGAANAEGIKRLFQ